MDHSEEVKEEREEEEYEPSINVRKTLKKMENQNPTLQKMNEASESYPYESESIGARHKRPLDIYEEGIKREDNDLDFELDLWVHLVFLLSHFKWLL